MLDMNMLQQLWLQDILCHRVLPCTSTKVKEKQEVIGSFSYKKITSFSLKDQELFLAAPF